MKLAIYMKIFLKQNTKFGDVEHLGASRLLPASYFFPILLFMHTVF